MAYLWPLLAAVDLTPNTPAEWSMIAVLGTMLATGALAMIAYVQLRAARAEARMTSRAYVYVSAEADRKTRTLNFVVANAGRTHAANVSIEWDQPIEAASSAASDFSDPNLWNPPLLLPGESFKTVLDFAPDRVDSDLPMAYTATVSWSSPATDGDERFTETYRVDFGRFYAMREWVQEDQEPRRQRQSLDNIAKAIDRLANATEASTQPPPLPPSFPLGDPGADGE